MINHPVLAYPDFTKPLRLTTDASGTGLGAVLEQDQDGGSRIIACASRTLSAPERNYSVTERECLGVVWATDHFSYYLLGVEFLIVTDHDPLTYLRSIPQPHGRLARWILKLEQYRYTLQYRAGKKIPHADGLSRIPDKISLVAAPTELSLSDLERAQREDPVIEAVRGYWRLNQEPPKTEEAVKEYFKPSNRLIEEEGVLMVCHGKGRSMLKQVIVPRKLVPCVLRKAHDEHHFAYKSTLWTVRKQYYWTSIFHDVAAYCRTCTVCQKRKHPQTAAKAPLQYFPVASEPGQMIAIDFMGPLPETPSGNTQILVITDAFSKYAEAIPLPDQKAVTTADALVNKYFCNHGIPAFLHSDQGKNFESDLIQHLCKMWNISKTRTSGYHPAGNGTVERYNKTLIETISMQMQEADQSDWERWIPMALFSYRSRPHTTTGYTPFQLHIGRQPRTPFDTLADSLIESKKKSAAEYLKELQQVVKTQKKHAQHNLTSAMESRKTQYDKKLNYRTYEKGEKVLCRDYACPKGLKPKLMKERWTGPWEIQCVRGPVNFRIQRKIAGKRKRLLVHHDRIKPFYQRPSALDQTPNNLLFEPADERPKTVVVSDVGSPPESHDPHGELGNAELDSDDDEDEEVVAGDDDPAGLPVAVEGDRQQQSPVREHRPQPRAQPHNVQPNALDLPRAEAASRSGRQSKRPVWHNDYHMK